MSIGNNKIRPRKKVFIQSKQGSFKGVLHSLFVVTALTSTSAYSEGYSPYSQPIQSNPYSSGANGNYGYWATNPNKQSQSVSNQQAQYSVPLIVEDPLPSYFKIGGDYTYVNFKPNGNPSLTGSLGGMQVMYEYRPDNGFYEGLEFSWKQGTVNGSGIKRSLLYLDAQERAGYTLKIDKIDFAMSFFTGLGFRHYGQTLTVSNATDLRFGYNEFYVPVGVFSNYEANGYCSIGLDLTWMPQIYPAVSIKPLKGAYWKLDYSLSSFSVKLPIMITPTKNKRFNILLDPFYEHWQDGESTATIANGVPLGLPANNYNFWGINLNFIYRF